MAALQMLCLGAGPVLGEDDEIVGEPHDARTACGEFFVEPVEKQVGEQRRERAALRQAASVGAGVFEPQADQSGEWPVDFPGCRRA